MHWNLHRTATTCALGVGLLASRQNLDAQQPCSPESGVESQAGWNAYRTGAVDSAASRFRHALALCSRNLDATIGLGYVALRHDQLPAADSNFQYAVARDSGNADAWAGLARTAYRLGDGSLAERAARNGVRLDPRNLELRQLLDRLNPDWERVPLSAPKRPRTLQLSARTHGERFEVRASVNWSPFYVRGVNLGVTLPGKFPSEFPQDSSIYAGWLDTIATMHANTVRVYTILPPAFYRALRAWNLSHSDQALWLIHGVWTELPPEHDFDDPAWKRDFREEMDRVVNLIHGNAKIAPRPGHASGRYDADVSRWVLGFIIGREWEPFAVKAFDARHPGTVAFAGRYLNMPHGSAMDRWMAEQCDFMVTREVLKYNSMRPVAYTNWPTLDPLHHPTESDAHQEADWRRRVGRALPGPGAEYENDAVGLDAALVHPTRLNAAGWFASYHAYPYYPDFMLYDGTYAAARSSEGRSNYFGYLSELQRHHAGMPLLISEYGVPSSRGVAHLQPQGWNHGGHDEVEMAGIDARLTREIRESGAAGGVIFALLDEWFKKNWIVLDYEIPQENTRQWHNTMDAEQNYGIFGIYAGVKGKSPVLGGDASRWSGLTQIGSGSGPQPGSPRSIRLGNDESYLYLAVELHGLEKHEFDWDSFAVRVLIDSYRRDLGQFTVPDGLATSDVGFEFLADFHGPKSAELRITPDYNPYAGADAIVNGDDFGHFGHRPITSVARTDGRFDTLFVITNRSRFARNGRFIPASGYDRGRLRYGTADQSSLSDWYYDRTAGLLEVRIPWGLLNVSDPSTGTLLFDREQRGAIGTATSDGMRVAALTYSTGSAPVVIGAAPDLGSGNHWNSNAFISWAWPVWTSPSYHLRLKPVYDSLRALWLRDP
ncbi:MAG: hypothetical protein ABJD11_04525 [Gemmatimonadota bacterium]